MHTLSCILFETTNDAIKIIIHIERYMFRINNTIQELFETQLINVNQELFRAQTTNVSQDQIEIQEYIVNHDLIENHE
jgi:hypothetical protein